MKTVIIYCHPDDLELNNLFLKMVVNGLEQAEHQVTIFRLFGDVYSPLILSSEQIDLPHNTNFDSTIKHIQETIKQSQHMVFVFPKYWDGLSYFMRRFIDEVFLSALGGGKIFATEQKLKFLKATIFTSMRIPQILFSGRSARGYSNPFTLSILKLCGIKNIKWFNVNRRIEKNPKFKQEKIARIKQYFIDLASEN